MQTLTPKHDRMLTVFLLFGLMILAFILTTLIHTVFGQLISNQSGVIEAVNDSAVIKSILLTMYMAFAATAIAFAFGIPLA